MNKQSMDCTRFLPPKGGFLWLVIYAVNVVKAMWKKALSGIPIPIIVGNHLNQIEEEGI